MSKAFDTIQRGTLIEDLKEILSESELYLIALLLENVELIVKLNKSKGDKFCTNIGSPQGDSASAIFFIVYLAKSLCIAIKNKDNHTTDENNVPRYCKQSMCSVCTKNSNSILDHQYNNPVDKHFMIDQQYADDIGWASTDSNEIDEIIKNVPPVLKQRNLFVNEAKTERYKVGKDGDQNWKKCKYVGSLLDTECDIKKRTQLANGAYSNLKDIFKSKRVSESVKLRFMNALIESIFLYNCEVWTLDANLERRIDVFQRSLLRRVLGIRLREHVSNCELYKRAKTIRWSEKVKDRRLSWFGHMCRLPESTPAKRAFYECLREFKRHIGRPKVTWLKVISKQLKELNIQTIDEGAHIARDRDMYRTLTERNRRNVINTNTY